MRRCLLSVLAGLMLAAAVPASGQTVTDRRVWTTLGVQGRTGEGSRGRWAVDSQFRMRDGFETADLFTLRGTIGRDLASGFGVGAGYGVALGFPSTGGTQVEHRVFQQVTWGGRFNGGSLGLRTRVEQRFLEDDSRMAVRLRQSVRLMRPLASSTLSLVIADEVMAHAGTTSRVRRGLDQHRVFVGVRRTLTPRTAVEIGYVNQYLRTLASSRMSHVLSVAVAIAGPG
jgi:hypothetical protein